MTTVVAALLALLYTGLKETHDRNEAIYNKKEILTSIDPTADKMKDEEIEQIFNEKVQQFVLNASGEPVEGIMAEKVDMAKERKKDAADRKYPLYIYEDEGKTYYIVSARGSGLWDEIWGAIALEEDFKTIAGVAFGHKAETPGLGAEIKDSKDWKASFKGKMIYDETRDKYLTVRKGGAKDLTIEVDAISGSTITGDGVTNMIKAGMTPYFTYFSTLKGEKTGQLIETN